MKESLVLKSGREMPLIGFGVFQIPHDICKQVVLDALISGYRLIDTASSYQNEKAVGEAIKEAGIPREEIFITSKAYIQEMGYDNTMKAFYRSLENLSLSYLDLYLIHMPFGDYYGSYRALEELYKKGLVKAIGVSNFLPDRLLDLCYNVDIKPHVNQIERHPFYQREEEIFFHRKENIQVQAWSPFGEGLKNMFHNPLLLEIAKNHHKSVPQIILRWHIEEGIAVIPKTTHKERMLENRAVFDFSLTQEEREAIRSLDTKTPSLLDTRNLKEIERVYDYLKNPVLTSL